MVLFISVNIAHLYEYNKRWLDMRIFNNNSIDCEHIASDNNRQQCL